ncbi:hypothetical protein D1AOALGA4SA_5375 [Olavius algarvensis Delta 1 endosymbiont]|nr:hypothetical protein D1AOALGA4SA_5375 [Olavius algarvensis Delta 1 endosymbiont]
MDSIFIFLFRQDLQDYQDFFRLRRGAFPPKAALSCRSCVPGRSGEKTG